MERYIVVIDPRYYLYNKCYFVIDIKRKVILTTFYNEELADEYIKDLIEHE